MGMFKQMKDLKKLTEAAPGMINQAQQLGAQAQQMGAAQQQAAGMGAGAPAAGASVPGVPAQYQQMAVQQQAAASTQAADALAVATEVGIESPAGGSLAPIAGVSIEQCATVSKGLAAHNYDQTKAPLVASQHGITGSDWELASIGWNSRITNDPSIAQAFNTAYRSI